MNTQFGKIAEFATAELAQLRKAGINFIQTKKNGQSCIEIRGWTIVQEQQDRIVCTKLQQDPIIFHSKTCAIIYVVNELDNNIANTITIQDLDQRLFRLRNEIGLLTVKMRNKSARDDVFLLLNNRYSEAAANLNLAISKVKKYCYLTKYNKGIMI